MWMVLPETSAFGPVSQKSPRRTSTVSSCRGLPSCDQDGTAK